MGKILIVDDEDDVRLSLQRRLEREGHSVQTAGSEAEAVECIEKAETPYDVVLSDMLMESPNSGVEVLKATLLRDVFTEVVILTAYGNVANAVECMKMGAFDYVEKNIPGVDVYELICIKIEQALERRRTSLSTVRRLEQFARIQEMQNTKAVT
ncbi:MAG: response regulator [Abitibacteriaceae bacterium]|nr:response regulator [Abditibacteriaceae bacterium]